MSPDRLKNEPLTVSYNPLEVMALIKREGGVTINSLGALFEYSPTEALRIMVDLESLGVISSGEDDLRYNPKRRAYERVWSLTETGQQDQTLQHRTLILNPLPIISKVIMETLKDVLEVESVVNIEDPESRRELIAQRMKQVLKGFSADELRGFVNEGKSLKK